MQDVAAPENREESARFWIGRASPSAICPLYL